MTTSQPKDKRCTEEEAVAAAIHAVNAEWTAEEGDNDAVALQPRIQIGQHEPMPEQQHLRGETVTLVVVHGGVGFETLQPFALLFRQSHVVPPCWADSTARMAETMSTIRIVVALPSIITRTQP